MEDRRRGSPAEQLRCDLERFREAGLEPERAFNIAYARIKWPHDTETRVAWKAILANDMPRWLEAYERIAPSELDHAAAVLVAA